MNENVHYRKVKKTFLQAIAKNNLQNHHINIISLSNEKVNRKIQKTR